MGVEVVIEKLPAGSKRNAGTVVAAGTGAEGVVGLSSHAAVTVRRGYTKT